MAIDIVIVGGGFAGLEAARRVGRLARERREVAVHLIDVNAYTTLVPSLPDLAGGRCASSALTENLERILERTVQFHRERVTAIDFNRRVVKTDRRLYPYDYLVLAPGSKTKARGLEQNLDGAHTLDTVDDAERIQVDFRRHMRDTECPVAVVVGGGYTGLELACALRRAATSMGKKTRLAVVECEHQVLPTMPAWVREYACRQAARQGIELLTGTRVESFDGNTVRLTNDHVFEQVFLCWTTGTHLAVSDLRGRHAQLKDGRLRVDVHLSVPQHPEVFAAGDAAAVKTGEYFLRKSVNFSLGAGRVAGRNVVHAVLGEPLERFRPVDLGWVIPFDDVGVGELFSRLRMTGTWPLCLHYAMCGLRNYNLANRLFFWKMAVRSVVDRRGSQDFGGPKQGSAR